jgi:hypothetical protein
MGSFTMSDSNTQSPDVRQALVEYNAAMEHLDVAERRVQDALKAIKTCANGATVNVDGQFFQVRERKDKLYLCELSGKPRGRPQGSKNKPKVKAAAAAPEGVEATESEPVFAEEPASALAEPETAAAVAVEEAEEQAFVPEEARNFITYSTDTPPVVEEYVASAPAFVEDSLTT